MNSNKSLFNGCRNRRLGRDYYPGGSYLSTQTNILTNLTCLPQDCHRLYNIYSGMFTYLNVVKFGSQVPGRLAAGDEDGGCHLFTADSGYLMGSWFPHENSIHDMFWVPNLSKIVTCSEDRSIRVSNAEILKSESNFLGHTRCVRCLAINNASICTFASGGRDGQTMLWDIRYPRRECCAFHPINEISAFSGENFKIHRQFAITSLAFVGEHKLAVASEASPTIKVWDIRRTYTNYKGTPLSWHSFTPCQLEFKNKGYSCLISDQSTSNLYANNLACVIYRFHCDSPSQQEVASYWGHYGASFFTRICLCPNEKWLISGSKCGKAQVWDTNKPGASLYHLSVPNQNKEVLNVAWSPNCIGDLVTSSNENLLIWRTRSEKNHNLIGQVCKNTPSDIFLPPALIEEQSIKKMKSTLLNQYFQPPLSTDNKPDTLKLPCKNANAKSNTSDECLNESLPTYNETYRNLDPGFNTSLLADTVEQLTVSPLRNKVQSISPENSLTSQNKSILTNSTTIQVSLNYFMKSSNSNIKIPKTNQTRKGVKRKQSTVSES